MELPVRRRAKLVAATGAGLAMLILTGCSQSPSNAATVGSKTISVDDVKLMTQALCTEHAGSGPVPRAASPVSLVSRQALTALIQSEVDGQYAAAHKLDYDRVSLAQQVNQLDPLIAKLPSDDRTQTRNLIEDLFRGELQMVQAGAAVVQQSGQSPSQTSVQQAVVKLEQQYSKKLDIQVNPRYNPMGAGHQPDGFQSLSTGVSKTATEGQDPQPTPTWVAGLPATQTCG